MSRTHRILLILLILQAALIAAAFWPEPERAGSDAPLLDDVGIETTGSIAITDETGRKLELVRQDNSWTLPAVSGYPADSIKVADLVRKIAGLKQRIAVAKTSTAHRRLKVADDRFSRMIVLTRAGSGKTDTLFLGTAPSQGQTHVRVAGQDDVYVVRDLATWEASAETSAWMARNYLDLLDKVKSVRIENSHGILEFDKADDSKWTMRGLKAGEKFDDAAWTPLLARASQIRMQDVLGTSEKPEWGLSRPALTLTLGLGDDKGLTFTAGAEDPKANNYPAKSSASSFYVTVPGYALKDLIAAERSQFVSAK